MLFSKETILSQKLLKNAEIVLWIFAIGSLLFIYITSATDLSKTYRLLLHFAIKLSYLLLAIGYACFLTIYVNHIKYKKEIGRTDLSMVSNFRLWTAVYFGIVFMFLILSVFLKINNAFLWAKTLAEIGIIGLTIGLIWIFIKEEDKESIFYKRIIYRSLLIPIFSCSLYFANNDVFVDFQWRYYPRFAKIRKELFKNPQNDSLKAIAKKTYEEERKVYVKKNSTKE